MSVASEITRLQNAKADLKTAIEGKGVTVSSSTKLDGYADLVDSIQQGGGGDDDNWYLFGRRSIVYVFTKTNDTTWTEIDAGQMSFLTTDQIYFQYKGEKYYVNRLDAGDNPLSKTGQPTIPQMLSSFLTATITKDTGGNFTVHVTYDD